MGPKKLSPDTTKKSQSQLDSIPSNMNLTNKQFLMPEKDRQALAQRR